jgi:hypothetical protein
MAKFKVTLTRPANASWTREIEAADADEAMQTMLEMDTIEELRDEEDEEVDIDWNVEPDVIIDEAKYDY